MAVTETGALLAELKTRTGLSWPALARTIGASSGDYVRKVAAGAKPGRNLDAAVRELMDTGRVTTAPERRLAASGAPARVRGKAGEPSRQPPGRVPTGPGAREVFRSSTGRLGWARQLDAITPGFAERFREDVRSAGRGGKRVSFRLQRRMPKGGTRWVPVGSKGGYRPRTVLAHIRGMGDGDVLEWLDRQAVHYAPGVTETVEVIAE